VLGNALKYAVSLDGGEQIAQRRGADSATLVEEREGWTEILQIHSTKWLGAECKVPRSVQVQ